MIEKELKTTWTFTLKPSTRAKLEELAKSEGRSSSDYLERMINRIKEESNLFENNQKLIDSKLDVKIGLDMLEKLRYREERT